MKKIFNILLVVFTICTVSAQKYKLIDAKHFSDYSKDCRTIGNCISSKYIKNGTLNVTIFINNKYRVLDSDGYSFDFKKGILSINTYNKDERELKDTIINGVKMHRGMVSVAFKQPARGGYDTQRYEFKFTGFVEVPKVIQFNHEKLYDCPMKPIKFEIYKKDTINVLNSNGKKHGLWLQFFATGEIQEKKYYDNGSFVSGKTFDRNGKDLHYIGEFSNGIGSLRIDTLINK